MRQIIRLDELTVLVLKDGTETGGQFCLCEMNVRPQVTWPWPHMHLTFDQTVVGMEGILLWSVGAEHLVLGPGERLFIPRGTTHAFLNRQSYAARFLCIYSPAVITPDFFEALHEAEQSEGEARVGGMDSVFKRFGSVSVTRN